MARDSRGEYTRDYRGKKVRQGGDGSVYVTKKLGPKKYKGGCFTSDTKILTPFGASRIADIDPGDLVISLSPERNTFSIECVINRVDVGEREIFLVQTESGAQVEVTETHSFLTDTGWAQCRNLRRGTTVHIAVGGLAKCAVVADVTRTSRTALVHNLHTTGAHTFVADSFIVHNYSYFPRIRAILDNLVPRGYAWQRQLRRT